MLDSPTTTGRRLRPQITMTVHPDTVDKMEALCSRFRLPRGQLVDKMVDTVHRMFQTGTVYCADGGPCRVGRKDLPDVF